MQTTYRIKVQEISNTFLKSVKMLFAGQEVEITVKSVEPKEGTLTQAKKRLLLMIGENRQNAPMIAPDIDIRSLIDNSRYQAQ